MENYSPRFSPLELIVVRLTCLDWFRGGYNEAPKPTIDRLIDEYNSYTKLGQERTINRLVNEDVISADINGAPYLTQSQASDLEDFIDR